MSDLLRVGNQLNFLVWVGAFLLLAVIGAKIAAFFENRDH